MKAQAERETLLKAEREARVTLNARAPKLVATQQLQSVRRLPLPSPSRWDPRIDSFWHPLRATRRPADRDGEDIP
jgi:hypothetical protein